jgi:hypothetical protein
MRDGGEPCFPLFAHAMLHDGQTWLVLYMRGTCFSDLDALYEACWLAFLAGSLLYGFNYSSVQCLCSGGTWQTTMLYGSWIQ